jgi:hypothetical protein
VGGIENTLWKFAEVIGGGTPAPVPLGSHVAWKTNVTDVTKLFTTHVPPRMALTSVPTRVHPPVRLAQLIVLAKGPVPLTESVRAPPPLESDSQVELPDPVRLTGPA